jgi:cob(I)alamin adenosyltransferase
MTATNAEEASPPVRVVLLTGDGRGKTTSALGLALRAAGHGRRVCWLQFVKGRQDTGEWRGLALLPGVEAVPCGLGFVPPPDSTAYARHRAAAQEGLRQARERLTDPRVDMVVLDEICVAVARGLLTEQAVLEALDAAHPGAVAVLTGRDAAPALLARADTASRIENLKHALDSGREAQAGVEW